MSDKERSEREHGGGQRPDGPDPLEWTAALSAEGERPNAADGVRITTFDSPPIPDVRTARVDPRELAEEYENIIKALRPVVIDTDPQPNATVWATRGGATKTSTAGAEGITVEVTHPINTTSEAQGERS